MTTLSFSSADHGEEFGEHGFDRHGKTLYRQVLRVPGIFKMPNSHLAGRRLMDLTSNVDLGPTLLDIAGVETPDAFQGQSISPILEKTTEHHRQRTFAELVSPKSVIYAVRNGRYKYIRQLLPELQESLTADAHNSLVSMDDAERLLREVETAVRLWYFDADAGRNRVELDEETNKVLEALGYIQ